MTLKETIKELNIEYKIAPDGKHFLLEGKKVKTIVFYDGAKGRKIYYISMEMSLYNILIRMMSKGFLPWADDIDMCYRCNGTGIVKQYVTVTNPGTCYKCHGNGVLSPEIELKTSN